MSRLTMAKAAEICGRLLNGDTKYAVAKRLSVAENTCAVAMRKLQEMGFSLSQAELGMDPKKRAAMYAAFEEGKLSNRAISVMLSTAPAAVHRQRHKYLADLRAAGREIPKCACGLDLNHPRMCSARYSVRTLKSGKRSIRTLGAEEMQGIKDRLAGGALHKDVAEAYQLPKCTVAHISGTMLTADERLARKQRKQLPAGVRRALQLTKAIARPLSTNPSADPLYARISTMIPSHIDPSLRDDMISDAYLRILEGEESLGDVRKAARHSIKRTYRAFASRWGRLSLDMPVAEGADETFADTVADPRALEAFERIG